MSRWHLAYKGTEVLSPEEWNAVVDALEALDKRSPMEIKGGQATFNGDGATAEFSIEHGMTQTPTVAIAGKGAPDLPDIDYWTVDETYIHVYFKTPPDTGEGNVKIWYIAIRLE